MQDEITKHSKRIYKKAVSKEHSLVEKIKDILIEILIIVFAVTLSIRFHSWSERHHNQEDAIGFLSDLKMDLADDIVSIKNAKQDLGKDIEILKSNDSINHLVYVTTILNDGNFEGFKSSGKIGYIENKELRLSLLHYYSKTYFGIQTHNNRCNEILHSLIFSDISKLSKLQQHRIQTLYTTEAQRNIDHFDNDLKDIQKIIKQIDIELAE
jgi:hypothetical protein